VKWTAYLPPAWTPTEYRLHVPSQPHRPKPVNCSEWELIGRLWRFGINPESFPAKSALDDSSQSPG